MTLASVDEALALVRAHAPVPRPAGVGLARAHDRILLEPVVAGRDQPPFDAAAMDGYAVATEMPEDQDLTVIGESQAGHAFAGALADGVAVRVFTGAPVPAGTRRVIMQEDIVRDGQTIRLRPGLNPTSKPHIRPTGSDFRAGDLVLQAGDRLTAWRLALAAATGMPRLIVARRPRVALICAGDELVTPGRTPRDDQIFESNSLAVAALARQWGAKVVTGRLHRDDRSELGAAIATAPADILVTIGGVSVGDYDLIRPALVALGVTWLFEGINIKPGKPTAFGILGDGRRVLCLPGNPGSALVCAQLFLKPLIAAALGAQVCMPLRTLPCTTGLPANGPRETYLRAVALAGLDGMPVLRPINDQDCGQLQSFAVTSALIRRPALAPSVPPGGICECVWLDV